MKLLVVVILALATMPHAFPQPYVSATETKLQTMAGPLKLPDVIPGNGAYIDARYYGVVADGSTDNTSSMQAAVSAACATSGAVRDLLLPAGTVMWTGSVTLPTACQKLRVFGNGSGGRTNPGDASGITHISYKGNSGGAFVLGQEATPARATILSAQRTSGVVTITATSNPALAALSVSSDQIMIRNLTPTDMNTEDTSFTSISTTGGTTTITYDQSGLPDETASSLTGAYVDRAWNDNNYYPAASQGFELANVHLTCDSTTRTQLLNYQSYTGQQSYATGAYGVQAWRAPNLILDKVLISGCQVGFFGTNSDEDEFHHSIFVDNHMGIWHSSQDSQELMDFLYTSGNDYGVVLDGTLNVTIRHWTSDTDGSTSGTAALSLQGNQLARSTTGTQCYDCWFENNHGPTTAAFPSFVQMGLQGATKVLGVDFYNPMFSMPPVPTANSPQTANFAEINNADQVHIHFPVNINHTSTNRLQPNPFLQFEGSTSPVDVVLETGEQAPNQAYSVTGTGSPSVQQFASLSGHTFSSNHNATWNIPTLILNTRGTATSGTTAFNSAGLRFTGSMWTGSTSAPVQWQMLNAVGTTYSALTFTPPSNQANSYVQYGTLGNATSTGGVSTNYNSAAMKLQSSYWNGTAAAYDYWIEQNIPETSGNSPTSTLSFSHSGSSGAAVVSLPHLASNAKIGASNVALGTGSGTSSTVTLTNATDMSGYITVQTGMSPATSAAIVTLTFFQPWQTSPKCSLWPANSATSALSGASQPFVPIPTAMAFTINAGSSPLAAATGYVWGYRCDQ